MWLTEVFSAFLRAENHTPVPGFKQWFGSGPRLSTALPHFLVCISILSVAHKMIILYLKAVAAAAAAAKSLQTCLTLVDPIDGSPPGSPVPGILQARTLASVAISFSNAWKWKVRVKSLSHVWLFTTPWLGCFSFLFYKIILSINAVWLN